FNYTKDKCTCKINTNNKVYHSRSSYERNFKKINIDFFKILYDKVLDLFDNESKNYNDIINILNDNEFDNLNLLLKPIDGVCSEYIKCNKLYTNQDVYSLD